MDSATMFPVAMNNMRTDCDQVGFIAIQKLI